MFSTTDEMTDKRKERDEECIPHDSFQYFMGGYGVPRHLVVI